MREATATDAVTGTPLAGMFVVAHDANSGDYRSSTATGSDGRYRMSLPSTGTYKLEFIDGSGQHVTEWFDNKADLASATPISFTAGTLVRDVSVALAPSA